MQTKEELQKALSEIEKRIETIASHDPLHRNDIATTFHLGMVGGSGNGRHVHKLNEQRERSIDVAIELAPLYREREQLQRLINTYDERLAKMERKQQEYKARQERLRQVKPGQQVILPFGNTVVVKRVNKKSITTVSGSKWSFDELFDVVEVV